MKNSINFITNSFTNAQLKKYKFLSAITYISQFILIISIVLVFFTSFWIVIIGILQLWIVKSLTFRCVNCFSNSKVMEDERIVDHAKYDMKRSPTQILLLQAYKCNKCNFRWENLVERTGHIEGIGRMSKDIKSGGKSRMKGESYTNWWRRNKSS